MKTLTVYQRLGNDLFRYPYPRADDGRAADGQYVSPVTVDEFRIAVAETYDVIVEPQGGAYTIFAQSMDRTGYARGHWPRD